MYLNKNIPTFDSYSQIGVGFMHTPFYPQMNCMWYYPPQ